MHLLLCFFFVVETALLLELSYLWNSLRLGFPSCHFLDSCKPSWLSTSLLVCSVPEQGGPPPAVLAGGVCRRPGERSLHGRSDVKATLCGWEGGVGGRSMKQQQGWGTGIPGY